MAGRNDYLQYVLEQLAGLGSIDWRRMFGGIGLYCDGFFFGLLSSQDMLYLKADDSNRGDYEAYGMEPFRPFRDKPSFRMAYYEVPADVLEDAAALVTWARKSVAVAAAIGKKRQPRSSSTAQRS
jgi:DNA transformation protein and related proteins